jgi:hypothetical protein
VLAYGYDLSGDNLTLFIYDPNCPGNDHVALKLNIGNPESKLDIHYTEGGEVLCFFKTNYSFCMPPGSGATPGRIILFEDENFCGRSIDIVRKHTDLSGHKAGNFKNFTSSFIILSGWWSFYRQPGCKEPILRKGSPIILGKGSYPRVSDYGIQDNEIVSLQAESKKRTAQKQKQESADTANPNDL